jgi:hypothetical protein
MKKLILFFAAILMISHQINAQIDAKELKRKRIASKYGYVDKNDKTVIPIMYEEAAYSFRFDLAYVKLNGKYGFINPKGKKVIPFKYDKAENFYYGIALVMKEGKWGGINLKGKVVIPFKYEKTKFFTNDLCAVKLNGKWGYVDLEGKEVIPTKYDHAEIFNYLGGRVKLNNKWGIIDKNGNDLVPLIYDSIGYVNEGFSHVKLNNKYGFIDKSYKVVIPIIYDEVTAFNYGESEVVLNGRKFYINKQGEESRVDLTKINKILFLKDNIQIAKDKTTNKYGYLNERDQIIIPFIYESASSFGNNRAPVTINNRKIYIDITGKEVIDASNYNYAQCFYNGYAVVQNSEKMYGYIDTSGKPVTEFIYTSADGFSSGLAAVCKDGLCGFLDLDLKPFIPFDYIGVAYFNDLNLVRVRTKNGKYGYLNKKGEMVIPAIYDDASKGSNNIEFNPRTEWPYQTVYVEINGKKIYFDKYGKEVPAKKISTPVAELKQVDTIALVEKDPVVDIITKTHHLKIYSGWKEVFKNSENKSGSLRGNIISNTKPAQIYKEAPDGWIKSEYFTHFPQIIIDQSDSNSIEKLKEKYIQFFMSISGMPRSKVKILEEKITLKDGRKGLIIFCVYPDKSGMIAGNFSQCKLIVESENNKSIFYEYGIYIESVPDLDFNKYAEWKDYFKKVLLTIQKN